MTKLNKQELQKQMDETNKPKTEELDSDAWKEGMTRKEVNWCLQKIKEKIDTDPDGYMFRDSFRAARKWDKQQVKLFHRLNTCCGIMEWTEKRWNKDKTEYKEYLLGFNFGH